MQVSVIQKDDWVDSWQMHRCYARVFHGERSVKAERPDFALLCMKDEKIQGFVTCIEMDSETLYWQFGGVFDEVKKTVIAKNVILACLGESEKLGFKRVAIRVENTNFPMLKLAMRFGFLAVGTYSAKNRLYLELLKELGGSDVRNG